MLFLVKVELISMPHMGPSGSNLLLTTIGAINADSEEEAARQLGLIRWQGWKQIPCVNKNNWERSGANFFFPKEDVKKIDHNPIPILSGDGPNLRGVIFKPVKMIAEIDPTKTFLAEI